MKGKKFNAAERHFKDKEVVMRKELRTAKEWLAEVCNVNSQLLEENKALRHELTMLMERHNKLLECSRISDSQLTTVIKAGQYTSVLTELFNSIRDII